MKMITTLALAVITAFFIGCGSSDTPDTPGAGETESPSIAIDDSTQNQDSSGTSNQVISSANLANMTIVSEYADGTKIKDVKKSSYIFLPNSEIIAVFDLFDGSRKVARGTYHESDGNNVAVIDSVYDNDESFIPAFGISTSNSFDQITVGESIGLYRVTAILDNDENGIDEATVASIAVEAVDENEDAPMHDALYGKSLSIYNNVTSDLVDGMQPTFEYADKVRYDSNVALHCTDYGYTTIFVEGTDDGVNSKVYMLESDSNKMCTEATYTSGASNYGSRNAVWY